MDLGSVGNQLPLYRGNVHKEMLRRPFHLLAVADAVSESLAGTVAGNAGSSLPPGSLGLGGGHVKTNLALVAAAFESRWGAPDLVIDQSISVGADYRRTGPAGKAPCEMTD
jgi:hypothetical protein